MNKLKWLGGIMLLGIMLGFVAIATPTFAADMQQKYNVCADAGFVAAAKTTKDLKVLKDAGCPKGTPVKTTTACPPINMFDAAVMKLRKELGCFKIPPDAPHGTTGYTSKPPCVELPPPPCEHPPCNPPPCEHPPCNPPPCEHPPCEKPPCNPPPCEHPPCDDNGDPPPPPPPPA